MPRIEIVAEDVTRQQASYIESKVEELPGYEQTSLKICAEEVYELHVDVEPLENPPETIEDLARKLGHVKSRVELFYLSVDLSSSWYALVSEEGTLQFIRPA